VRPRRCRLSHRADASPPLPMNDDRAAATRPPTWPHRVAEFPTIPLARRPPGPVLDSATGVLSAPAWAARARAVLSGHVAPDAAGWAVLTVDVDRTATATPIRESRSHRPLDRTVLAEAARARLVHSRWSAASTATGSSCSPTPGNGWRCTPWRRRCDALWRPCATGPAPPWASPRRLGLHCCRTGPGPPRSPLPYATPGSPRPTSPGWSGGSRGRAARPSGSMRRPRPGRCSATPCRRTCSSSAPRTRPAPCPSPRRRSRGPSS